MHSEICYTKSIELFELKLLFIKVKCLINVNKICGLLRNVSSTTK